MSSLRWVWLLAALVSLVPLGAYAAPADREGDVTFRVNGPVRIRPNETTSSAIVIGGDAIVEGTVRDTLVVINGNAIIAGTVGGEVTVVGGTLTLRGGSSVNNVSLINSTLVREPGATITGRYVPDARRGFARAGRVMGAVAWIGMTLTLMLAGLLFAAVGGRPLWRAAEALGHRAGPTLLAAFVLWSCVPALALTALLTVVGIPLGLALLVGVLPALWVLGYLVSATGIGRVLSRVLGRERIENVAHPYVPVLLGVLVLQLIGLLPFVGFAVILLAGLLGAGALTLVALQSARRGPTEGTGMPVPVPS